MHEVHIYISIDSTAVKVSQKCYGYVLECTVSGEVVTREGFGEIAGTYHQATLKAMTEAMRRLKKTCEVCLHVENEFILHMIERNLDTWAGNGFQNVKGRPVANQEEWMTFWTAAKQQTIRTESGKHDYSDWMSGEMKRRKERGDV